MNCIFCGEPLLEGKLTDGWLVKEFWYSTTDDEENPKLFHNTECNKVMEVSKDSRAYYIAYAMMPAPYSDFYINHVDPDDCWRVAGIEVNDVDIIPIPKTEQEFFDICRKYNPLMKLSLVNFK